MATTRKRQPARSEVPDDDELPATPVTTAAEDEASFVPEDVAVLEMLEEYKGDADAVVRIYRQGTNYRDLTLMHECAPAEFTPMMLAHEPFNGGTFRLHIRSRTGLFGNRLLKVMPAAGTGKPINGTATNNDAVLTALAETNKNIHALAQAVTTRQEPPNPLATLEGIRAIAEIIKPATAPVVAAAGNDFTHTMAAVQTFLNAARAMAPAVTPTDGEGKVDVSGMVLSKAVDLFGEAMKSKMNQSPSIPIEVARADNAQPTALNGAASDVPPEVQEEIMLMQIMLKRANKAATVNADPEGYAEDALTFFNADQLREFSTDATWFEKLCQVVPECAANRAWFEKVRQAMIEFATEDGILTAAPNAGSVDDHGATAPSEPAKPDGGA